jgi:hypothetical protein
MVIFTFLLISSFMPLHQMSAQNLYGIGVFISPIDEGILIMNVLVVGTAFEAGINNGDIINDFLLVTCPTRLKKTVQ